MHLYNVQLFQLVLGCSVMWLMLELVTSNHIFMPFFMWLYHINKSVVTLHLHMLMLIAI